MSLTFTIYITDEGIRATREVQQNPGWYIIPYQFRVSDTNRGINAQRTYSSIDNNPWYSGIYAALTASGTENKIIHNVVVPPIITGVSTEKNYGEIYFIYKDHNGNELLYAIGAPSETLTYTPGVSQKFYFSFTLNNVQTSDVIHIDEADVSNKANVALNNLTASGEAHFANPSLSNLNTTGEAHFANPSLSNLNTTGEAHFANPNMSNLSSTGKNNTSLWAFENMNIQQLSGTNVQLLDNRVHAITLTGNTAVNLPLVSDNTKFHQLLILVNMPTTVYTINWHYNGSFITPKYFYNNAISMTLLGKYTIICEYNGTEWVVGALYKGA